MGQAGMTPAVLFVHYAVTPYEEDARITHGRSHGSHGLRAIAGPARFAGPAGMRVNRLRPAASGPRSPRGCREPVAGRCASARRLPPGGLQLIERAGEVIVHVRVLAVVNQSTFESGDRQLEFPRLGQDAAEVGPRFHEILVQFDGHEVSLSGSRNVAQPVQQFGQLKADISVRASDCERRSAHFHRLRQFPLFFMGRGSSQHVLRSGQLLLLGKMVGQGYSRSSRDLWIR